MVDFVIVFFGESRKIIKYYVTFGNVDIQYCHLSSHNSSGTGVLDNTWHMNNIC